MRIEDVQRLEVDGRSRLAATAIWETTSSDPVDLYFEVPAEHATALSGNPDPFLVGCCSVLAALAGEERLVVAGADPQTLLAEAGRGPGECTPDPWTRATDYELAGRNSRTCVQVSSAEL